MDATVRFYHGVLGARLAATIGTPEFRHYFFDFGPQCTVAFFEYTGIDLVPFAKPAGVPDARAVQFDHLSLNLPDEGRCTRCASGSPTPGARSPTSSTTASSTPCTSPTRTGSPSRRRGGCRT